MAALYERLEHQDSSALSPDVLDRRGFTVRPSANGRTAANDSSGLRSPIIYLVNQYPAVSHTFIRREIRALEDLGATIIRQAMRAQSGLVDTLDKAERERTEYLLEKPADLPVAFAAASFRPRRMLPALAAMAGMMHRSDRPPHLHLIYLLEACELARRIQRHGAGHIHAHFGTNPAEVAMLAAEIAGVSFSFTVHGHDEFDKPEFLGLRRKMAAARFVATVSDYGRAQLMRWCRPEDRQKIHVIRCGLDFRQEPTESTGTGARHLGRFVCVGRFCQEKAQNIFVEALAELRRKGRDVEGVLVGDGPSRPEIEALAAARGLGGHVRFAGWLSGQDVLKEMRAARALVVSSFAENLPVVITEAMAARRPVVATSIAGIPEIVVPGRTGWLAPPGAPEKLAGAMESCLDLPADGLAEMGELGRAFVQEHHDIHTEARKLLALFPAS
jgi:glycosyltransferase involved in cell wall biosynthesis